MALVQIIEQVSVESVSCKNDNSVYQHFLIIHFHHHLFQSRKKSIKVYCDKYNIMRQVSRYISYREVSVSLQPYYRYSQETLRSDSAFAQSDLSLSCL